MNGRAPARMGAYRLAAAALAAAGALTLAACAATDQGGDANAPLRVYVSLPLSGPRAADGRDAADGARLALADAGGRAGGDRIEAVYLDDSRGGRDWDPVAAGANARRASEDSSTVAYVGELQSGATRTSLPILNQAEIAQVSPGSGSAEFTRGRPSDSDFVDRYRPSGIETFARVLPDDRTAAAEGAAGAGAKLVPVAALPGGPDFERRFRARFGRAPSPWAAVGYEAMALALQTIAEGGAAGGGESLRGEVAAALVDAERPDSILGGYEIAGGDSNLDLYLDAEVSAPREFRRLPG